MSLSSVPFLFGALPIFLLLYFCSKPQYRIYELLLFSGWFYYVNDPGRIKYIIALIAVNYVISILIGVFKNGGGKTFSKLFLVIGIGLNLFVLFFYKYLAFSAEVVNEITGMQIIVKERSLMVGLSFFTFTLIAYLADVYWGKVKVPQNIVKFANYVLMFPKILMGPIVRYNDISDALDSTEITINDMGTGAKRFMCGFFKKIIIADNLALLVNEINATNNFSDATVVSLWLGAIAFSLQLFFDFSGYSDMAIGIAGMLGFHFRENFNYPYCCKSFTDFWRRWHISLSEWFRDYVYIPLGGSRRTFSRNIFNLLAVWVLTGIWHGAGYSFIAWGLVYFIMLVLEKHIIKPNRLNNVLGSLWRVFTLIVVNFNWVLFSHNEIKEGLQYCLGMFGIYYRNTLINPADIRYIREYGVYLIIGILFSTPIAKVIGDRGNRNQRIVRIAIVVTPVLYLLAFVWALSFVMLGFHNPFLYQKF